MGEQNSVSTSITLKSCHVYFFAITLVYFILHYLAFSLTHTSPSSLKCSKHRTLEDGMGFLKWFKGTSSLNLQNKNGWCQGLQYKNTIMTP